MSSVSPASSPAGAPEVSYIVLSYNYETYIRKTLASILEQTHQDFEIVVVDDASTDGSCAVVEALADPRIRLIRNPVNLGGAASYNKAVSAARGTWLGNLDADDWIAPNKTQVQLDVARDRLDIAVIGSYVHFVGADGLPLPDADLHEVEVNTPRDLNALGQWIGRNAVCRSSTLVRRAAHLAVGLDDETMTRAPDYELWTRFLTAGHSIEVVPERLTYYRLHARGVTYGDPVGTFTEMCWILLRNIKPKAEATAAWRVFGEAVDWVATHPRLADLGARERERLLGFFLEDGQARTYAAFRHAIGEPDARREALGRRVLALAAVPSRREMKADRDITLFIEARDYWKGQHDRLAAASDPPVSPALIDAASRVPGVRHLAKDVLSGPLRWLGIVKQS